MVRNAFNLCASYDVYDVKLYNEFISDGTTNEINIVMVYTICGVVLFEKEIYTEMLQYARAQEF